MAPHPQRHVKQPAALRLVAIMRAIARRRRRFSAGKLAKPASSVIFAPRNRRSAPGGTDMRLLRRTTATVASVIAIALFLLGPARAADPVGTWLTGDKKGKVRIVNCGGAICGTLVWLQEPNDPETHQPKTDKNNVDASKQGRPLIGVPIVLNMKPNGGDSWQGQVYNAEDGNTYSGSFTMSGANAAQLKGCVMGGLICKSQTWTRTN
jgi:uncharacterized protein (DUF2147 family)